MPAIIFNEAAAPSTPAAGTATYGLVTVSDPRLINDDVVSMSLGKASFNYVRNSGFWFAQRQAPAVATTYTPPLSGRSTTADGWGIGNNGAESMQYTRIDTISAPEAGLFGRYYGTIVKSSANSRKCWVWQVLESHDSSALRGQTVRLQLWAKVTGADANWRFGLVAWTNTAQVDAVPVGGGGTLATTWDNTSGVEAVLAASLAFVTPSGVSGDNTTIVADTNTGLSNGYQAAVTASWQRFGGTFLIPKNVVNLCVVVWSNNPVPQNSGLNISQVSLTRSVSVQTWQPQPYSNELRRVQRLYSKSFDVDVAPAQNVAAGCHRGYVSVAGAVANQPIRVVHPVRRRLGSPVYTFYNPFANNAFVRNTVAGTNATATTVSAGVSTGDSGLDVLFTGIAGWTVAQAVAVHYTMDYEL